MQGNTNAILAIIIIVALLFLLDLYTFQGVKSLSAGIQAGFARKGVYWAYWLFFLAFYLALAYAVVDMLPSRKPGAVLKFLFNGFLAFLLAKLVFVFVLFSEDLARLVIALGQKASQWMAGFQAKENFLPERRKVVSQLGVIVAGLPFASVIYGVTKGKYNFKVHRHTLYFENLPENFEGFTITQVSDIHAGSFDDFDAVRRGVELIKAQKSDIVVFTGDLVNNFAREIEPYLELFSQVEAPFGKFSILGNHDYGDYVKWKNAVEKQQNLEELFHYHEQMGFQLLLDEKKTIERAGQSIHLLGVENWGHGFGKRGDLDKALKGCLEADFKILLSHDPSHWDGEVKNHKSNIQLTLSGHTHGMQFGIEIPGFKWSPSKFRYPNWAGLTEEFGRKLYVNRGFGFIGFSGRVGIWPEITVLELRKK